jgi:hypothetical protein
MICATTRPVTGVFLILLFTATAHSQTVQFLPEINTYVSLDSNVRFSFQAKETREDGGPTQAEIGPSIDLYLRPLKNLIGNQVDASKTRFILLSFGYRYVPSSDARTVNRILMVATPQIPVKWKLVLSDRSRGELNFSNGDPTWRYRNQLQLERVLSIHSYHPTPYANVEFYYDSRYGKWSSTAIEVGCQFPVRKHSEIQLYYQHQNNTGIAPNQQINAIGLMLNLYF